MNDEDRRQVNSGWWNGINVIYKDTKDKIKPILPPTERSRLLFENEHQIHSHQLGEYSISGLKILRDLYTLNIKSLLKTLIKTFIILRKERNKYKERFIYMNTFSSKLPSFNINDNHNKF